MFQSSRSNSKPLPCIKAVCCFSRSLRLMKTLGAVRGAERVFLNQRLCAAQQEMDLSLLSSILNYTALFLSGGVLHKDRVALNGIITTHILKLIYLV